MTNLSDTLAALDLSPENIAEQVQALRNHADERQRKGWLTSAHNLRVGADYMEALSKELAAYRTGQLVPVPSVEWQPIKTAPKDGTAVLLGYFHENLDGSIYQEGGEPIVARWVPQRGTNEREANWVARSGRLLSGDQAFAPTHWQPLPQPPQQL